MMGIPPDMMAAMAGGVPGMPGMPGDPAAAMPEEPLSPESMEDPAMAAAAQGAPVPPEAAPPEVPPEIRAVIREELEAMLTEKEQTEGAGDMVSMRSELRSAQARIQDLEDLLAEQGLAAAPSAEQPGAVAGLPEETPLGEELPGDVAMSDLPPGFADLDMGMGGAPPMDPGMDPSMGMDMGGLPMKTAAAPHHWGKETDPYVV
jgi:hypothetical protein